MTKIAENAEGRLDFDSNELVITDLTEEGDPVAIRLRSKNKGVGKISIDRPSGNGQWFEFGYIFAKVDERFQDERIEFEFWKSGSRDEDADRLFAIRTDGVVFYKPVSIVTNPTRVLHESKKFITVFQGDGNIVTYRADNFGNPIWNNPVWASGFSES